ncbi:MAG: SDR family oxidoreductase [Pirellulales bacterium]|nr:SDR family oxidoreductase [Pirellulales bacterium]
MSAEYLKEMFGLDGQTAVVIGGAGVLGGALCRGLVQAGAHVVVADVTEDGCKARVEELQGLGGQASHALVNVTDRASLEALLEAAKKPTGRCDILVNCAGVNNGTAFLDHTEEAWDRVIAINLKGTFLACQVFGRHMVDNGTGAIVNIGSVTSHLPLSRVFGYGASKAGVLNLTRNIADDFGPKGVRVNCICPGFFPAEQNRKLLDQDRIDNIIGGTPMGRFGEPDELVGALLLLVARKAGQFITGTHINVDGGFMAAWF